MAQQNRVTLQALIDLYITTNGNKEITGAQLNEVLTNLNDSAFLQLDEIRTALSTAYSPATPSDWNVLPTEVKAALDEAISRVEGLENAGFQTAIQTPYTLTVPADWDGTPNELQGSTDELASRVRTLEDSLVINPSEHIAYVSDTGSDVVGEYEVGNPLKPFATFTAAITAVPNGGIIKALGGIYNINYIINISGTNKRLDLSSCQITTTQYIGILGTNNVLDISNCQITGRIAFRGGTNNTIFAQGATVTPTVSSAFLTTGAGDCTVYGGTFDGNTVGSGYSTVVTTGHVTFINSIIKASTQIAATSAPSTFIDCEIESLSNTGLSCTGETILKGTTVKGNLIGSLINNTNLIVNNSNIEGERGIVYNSSPTNTQNLKITNNSVIKGTNGNGVELYSINEYLLVQDSQISGTTNTVTFNSFERLNNEVSVFNNCYLICGSGNIFVEGYDGTDTGKALVNYCWINKALPVYTDITDAYTTLDTGLQIF